MHVNGVESSLLVEELEAIQEGWSDVDLNDDLEPEGKSCDERMIGSK